MRSKALDISGVSYIECSNIADEVLSFLAQGHIIGWFQGRSEFGPRALGARSIIADETATDIKKRINSKVKFRESYRPFAPIVGPRLFSSLGIKKSLEYMTVACFPSQDLWDKFGETIHKDGSTRVQCIGEAADDNPMLRELVSRHEECNGGALLNTSFNLAGEPLVETPMDALRTFYASGIEKLAIGPYLLSKS